MLLNDRKRNEVFSSSGCLLNWICVDLIGGTFHLFLCVLVRLCVCFDFIAYMFMVVWVVFGRVFPCFGFD